MELSVLKLTYTITSRPLSKGLNQRSVWILLNIRLERYEPFTRQMKLLDDWIRPESLLFDLLLLNLSIFILTENFLCDTVNKIKALDLPSTIN